MRVVAKKSLREFWESHADCKDQLKSWYDEAENAEWKLPADIKRGYPSASIIVSNRVVFNIKGNSYRLIVKINYGYDSSGEPGFAYSNSNFGPGLLKMHWS